MRDKKWVDCPVCGAKMTMRKETRTYEKYKILGYPPVTLRDIDGQFCSKCGDGFWSQRSKRKISHEIAEHRAKIDATRVVVADLSSVQEAAKAMSITVQGVHKMMDQGRLRFVVAGGRRLPIKEDLAKRAKIKKRAGTTRHAKAAR